MNTPFASRCKKILSILATHQEATAALISSNPHQVCSNDTHYPYTPNSDLYYLTGAVHDQLSLLISSSSQGKELILYAPPYDPVKALWEGEQQESAQTIAKRIGATLVETKDPLKEITTKLRTTRQLYYQPIPKTISYRCAESFFQRDSSARGLGVSSIIQLDVLLAPLRMIKSKDEILAIKKAVRITAESLTEALSLIGAGATEKDLSSAIDYGFTSRGATSAFNTIVATGPSAAVLHYTNGNKTLKSDHLVLIDCGARFEMYCADISRTYPVSPEPSSQNLDLLEIVASAQEQAIQAIKPGASIYHAYKAAAKELWKGLKALKICKLPFERSLKEKELTTYFPHSIGHSLGIDVHDVTGHINPRTACFEEGMVYTIEPGLYFSKKTGSIAPMGIRLEEDVVVTARGAQVLTEYIP